jgi:hypothetical protein
MLLTIAKILEKETCAEMKEALWKLHEELVTEKIKYYRSIEVKK